MNEKEWFACRDAHNMLEFLANNNDLLPISQYARKFRLFAVACCRVVWDMLDDVRSRRAVEVAERHADGLATDRELEEAWRVAKNVGDSIAAECAASASAPFLCFGARIDLGGLDQLHSEMSPLSVVGSVLYGATAATAYQKRFSGTEPTTHPPLDGSQLVHEIFGNPFQPTEADSDWLAWEQGKVVSITNAIYQERLFCDAPVLADALEDAGCTCPDILEHLRGEGQHCRGCWVLDLILEKD